MILEYNYTKELQECAFYARQECYDNSDNDQYPVNYDPYICWLRELKDIPMSLDQILDSTTDLENVLPEPQFNEVRQTRQDTGILDSLLQELQMIDEDIRNVHNPQYTKSLRLNNLINRQIEDYWNNRISRYATRIFQHIQALITLDSWNDVVFGNYKAVMKAFESSETNLEKQRHLDELILISRSIIPPYIKRQEVRTVESSFTSTVRTL